MRNIWTIAKKEFNHYFISPIAYVSAAVILLFLGGYFTAIINSVAQQAAFGGGGQVPDAGVVNGLFAFFLVLMVPFLTMRTLSEESRAGTIELLLTAPVREFELVTGKWLGGLLFLLCVSAFTLVYPLILYKLTTPGIDLRIALTSYIGLILMIGALFALGVGISAMFKNQIATLFVTFGLFIVLWWLIGIPGSAMPVGGGFFNYLVFPSHFNNSFNSGKLVLSDAIYYLSLIAVGLFAGTSAIEVRRWK